ncbi:unnamed protein product, partial [Medioppia subpectinata]
DGNCVGTINKKTNAVDWLTYAQVLARVKHFGDGLIHMGLKCGQNTFIGIYATNCVEYVIAEYGAYSQSLVVIPLYDTLGPNACRYIINKVLTVKEIESLGQKNPIKDFGDEATNKNDTMLSFLPLAHMFERCCQSAVFMVGGKTAFFSGDIKNLADDMKIVRPTVLAAVPRVMSRIYDKCHTNIKGNKLKEWLLRKAIESKLSELQKRVIRRNGFWDKLVFKPIRNGMGGKVRLICVCPCTLTVPGDYRTGHVGPPLPCCSIRLESVPDMQYYTNDGRGEVWVKGPIVFNGYFKDPEKTAIVITPDGWLKTGDIGEWTENGTLRIIDRKKHIFKLSQGEYIAPEKIEGIYSKSSFIAQIFVYGESFKSCLVAVVVPEVTTLTVWCRKNNIRGTLRDLCQNKEVKRVVMNDLLGVGKKEGLLGFEQLRDIYLHYEAFTIDNGLLTPTLKTKRLEIRKYFDRQLEDMYRSLD